MKHDKISDALRLVTRNAMTPGIVFGTLIGLACISAALIAPIWLAIWLMIILTALVLINCGIFAYHSIKNPTLLQSEEYQLKREAITIYGSTSYEGEQIVDVVTDRRSNIKLLPKEVGNND